MPNSRNLPSDTTALLDAVGGEPLAGSGFEGEAPETAFDQPQLFRDDAWRTGRSQKDK